MSAQSEMNQKGTKEMTSEEAVKWFKDNTLKNSALNNATLAYKDFEAILECYRLAKAFLELEDDILEERLTTGVQIAAKLALLKNPFKPTPFMDDPNRKLKELRAEIKQGHLLHMFTSDIHGKYIWMEKKLWSLRLIGSWRRNDDNHQISIQRSTGRHTG